MMKSGMVLRCGDVVCYENVKYKVTGYYGVLCSKVATALNKDEDFLIEVDQEVEWLGREIGALWPGRKFEWANEMWVVCNVRSESVECCCLSTGKISVFKYDEVVNPYIEISNRISEDKFNTFFSLEV